MPAAAAGGFSAPAARRQGLPPLAPHWRRRRAAAARWRPGGRRRARRCGRARAAARRRRRSGRRGRGATCAAWCKAVLGGPAAASSPPYSASRRSIDSPRSAAESAAGVDGGAFSAQGAWAENRSSPATIATRAASGISQGAWPTSHEGCAAGPWRGAAAYRSAQAHVFGQQEQVGHQLRRRLVAVPRILGQHLPQHPGDVFGQLGRNSRTSGGWSPWCSRAFAAPSLPETAAGRSACSKTCSPANRCRCGRRRCAGRAPAPARYSRTCPASCRWPSGRRPSAATLCSRARPMSISLAAAGVIRMFEGLMSRCTTLRLAGDPGPRPPAACS